VKQNESRNEGEIENMVVKCKKKKKKTYIRKEGQERCLGPGGKNIWHIVLP